MSCAARAPHIRRTIPGALFSFPLGILGVLRVCRRVVRQREWGRERVYLCRCVDVCCLDRTVSNGTSVVTGCGWERSNVCCGFLKCSLIFVLRFLTRSLELSTTVLILYIIFSESYKTNFLAVGNSQQTTTPTSLTIRPNTAVVKRR